MKTLTQKKGTVSSSKRWVNRTRPRKVSRNPYCERCMEANVRTPVAQVHHIVPVKDAPHLAHDMSNLMSLCTQCHGIQRTSFAQRNTLWGATQYIKQICP